MKRKILPHINARTLIISALASVALSACKTQSTSSQSPSGMPASKPPASSPSTPSTSSSSSRPGSSKPEPSRPATSSSGAPKSSSDGQQTSRGSSLPTSSLPTSSQPNSPASGAPGASAPSSTPDGTGQNSRPSQPGQATANPDSAPIGTPEVLDSPYYEAYDPAADTDIDIEAQVDGTGTSPASRSDQVSFEEGQNGSGQSSSGPANSGQNGQSSAERQASLEAELEGSFGRYDGMILRERDKVLADGANRGAEDQLEQSPPGFDGEGGQGNNPYGDPKTQAGGQQQGNANNQGENQGDGQSPNGSSNGNSSGRPGAPSANNLPAAPDDIPDGRDDDIVARQIREAAMAEKDPKLREKLWEEYRKYKQR